MSKVIAFTFAGRRENMELQVPCMKDVLARNPEVEWHIWDLARKPEDSAYLRTIEGERICVMTQFAGDNPWERFSDVYEHYTDAAFEDVLFVKMDDDDVFIESARFDVFVDVVRYHRDYVVSAQVINNGACSMTDLGLRQIVKDLRIPLLNVHLKPKYALSTHKYFFDNSPDFLDQPAEPVDTKDWLSINLIGYDWDMGKRIFDLLGTRPPRNIAGRIYDPTRHRVGDEGAVNMLPRMIMKGFVVGHLYFGPQEKKLTRAEVDGLRFGYRDLGEFYRKEHP